MFTEHFEVPNNPELNGTVIQCIAIQLCVAENEICKPVVCLSNRDVIDIMCKLIILNLSDIIMCTHNVYAHIMSLCCYEDTPAVHKMDISSNSTTVTEAEPLLNEETGKINANVLSCHILY